MPDKPLISIIVPSYNEAASLPDLHRALTAVIDDLPYDWELIFVDDGSRDDTAAILTRLAAADARVRPLELARNFGKEIAVTAALHECRGEAAIIMDADLQHPPAIIPQFLDAWEAGAEVVVGVRRAKAHHAGLLKRSSSAAWNRFMNIIADQSITPGATDFRLLDRLVIDEFNRFTERNRLTRGLIDWLGFRRTEVYFEPAARVHGDASYSWRKLVRLGMHSVVSLSLFPLRLAGYVGTAIIAVSLPLGIFMFVEKYLLHDPMGYNFTGTAQLAVLIVFLVGIILASLGLMSLYIAAIYAEVTNRPLYV
ncbi:MAG TPA: glycosyltransferase family 2 protein, partial [Candidatus Saccharimonadia bacterium]